MPTLKAKKNGTFPLPHKAKTALPKNRVYSIDSVNFIEYRRKIFLRAYTALKNFADTHQQKGRVDITIRLYPILTICKINKKRTAAEFFQFLCNLIND